MGAFLNDDIMACLDTNVIIEYMKGNKKIIDLVNSYALKEEISSTTITEYELWKYYDQRKIKQISILESIKMYSFDRPAAKKAAEIFNLLKEKGKLINENDMLIAAMALANRETLITRDKDFNEIGDDRILVI
jgi:tRNA(fMet)-specific endonuclease VapC